MLLAEARPNDMFHRLRATGVRDRLEEGSSKFIGMTAGKAELR